MSSITRNSLFSVIIGVSVVLKRTVAESDYQSLQSTVLFITHRDDHTRQTTDTFGRVAFKWELSFPCYYLTIPFFVCCNILLAK